jgi:hypothetical protein
MKKKNTRKTSSVPKSKEKWSDTVQRTREIPVWTPFVPTFTPKIPVLRWVPEPVYVPVPIYVPIMVYPAYPAYPAYPFPITHITIC